ncbi:uncharacterized protein LOC130808069 isoform X2 [Amaranthus tricolor]|uniref:uncharacterized protein LOC130808069 isoform X2 n=1 Tax=Amaranthus tricolor TaxID=29722 RepID=UPI00258F0FEE|nr:uncharacterized protein LOC130808069 isoform X2 [Amaranthus tricolor]
MEKDIIEDDDPFFRHEGMAEDAPPYPSEVELVPTDAPTITTSVGSKKRKGRGPTKSLKVTEPMHLEYNALGQPCGKWRRQYGKQIGICSRKISILYAWNEVPEDLKNSLWDDIVNLFHIENNKEKKNVFLSAVAKRFRDFKSKLVTGWITKKRARKTKKVKTGNEGGDQAPSKMPYEIWGHISKNEWEEFVAKKTTPTEVEKRGKASESASKRKFYHRLGPKTYDEVQKEWVDAGLYPNQGPTTSSTANSAFVNTPAGDRVRDWYCGLHSRDSSGKYTITDPGAKKVADAVIGWKEKEATREFTHRDNVDALHIVLGKDQKKRVFDKGGVRVGLKKAFGKECVATQSRWLLPEEVATLRREITKDILYKFACILQKMGAPIVDLTNMIGEDQFTTKSPKGSKRETDSSSKAGSNSMGTNPILTDAELKDLSPDCKWLHTCASRMCEENPIMLPLDKDQFSFAENPFVIIGPRDIGQFLRGEMLNVALIHVYMSTMKKVRVEMGSRSRDTYPKWKTVKCFRQPSNSVDCGYYTLKYMDDILKSVKEIGVENIDAVLYDIPRETRPLRSGEMRELKDKIAAYLANFCP